MILIRNRLSQLILGRHYNAMSVWPLIFVRPGTELSLRPETLNHEHIHARQQLEMIWLFFFVWYGVEYTVRLLQHRNHHKAYHAISHEKEAFANDENLNYLKKRKAYAWMKYL
jgi:hypothetical protein